MHRLILALLGATALGGTALAGVIPPGQPVAGIPQATLADQWALWINKIPQSVNPLTNDPTGANARVNNNGPVFFLAGTSVPGFATRSFTVPAGVPLFMPLANWMDVEVPTSKDPGSCLGTSDPYTCALGYLGTPTTNLMATLDGVNLLAGGNPPLLTSADLVGPFCLPVDSIYSPPYNDTCGAKLVQTGYYLAIDPLPPGTHTLIFGGDGAATGYGAIDTISVVPEPAGMTLLGLGLLTLGLARRARGD